MWSYQIFVYHFPIAYPEMLLTMSKSNFDSWLWSPFSATDQNKLLTFHVPIFIFILHIHVSSSFVSFFRGSSEKFLTITITVIKLGT